MPRDIAPLPITEIHPPPFGRLREVESGRLAVYAKTAAEISQAYLPVENPKDINQQHLQMVDLFLARASVEASPPVMLAWWEHTELAAEIGASLAQAAEGKGVENVYPMAQRVALKLHDMGRLVNPPAYLRESYLGEYLMKHLGLGCLTDQLQSLRTLLLVAQSMGITEDQMKSFSLGDDVSNIFTPEQMKGAERYYDDLSTAEKISIVADNLGKRDNQNNIFTLDSFLGYLRSQELRYSKVSEWPIVNWSVGPRQQSTVLQAYVVERAILEFENMGINVDSILTEAERRGPKFVILVRHGAVDNPKGIVYNRDKVMIAEDVVSIGDEGKRQIMVLTQLLNRRGVKGRVTKLIASPEKRARATLTVLKQGLGLSRLRVRVYDRVDDTYAPGPYREGLAIDTWRRDGNPYDRTRWGQYNHETPESIVSRMNWAIGDVVNGLRPGQVAVVVSHGDPLAWWGNASLYGGEVPNYPDLDDVVRVDPASAMLAIYTHDGRLRSLYPMTE